MKASAYVAAAAMLLAAGAAQAAAWRVIVQVPGGMIAVAPGSLKREGDVARFRALQVSPATDDGVDYVLGEQEMDCAARSMRVTALEGHRLDGFTVFQFPTSGRPGPVEAGSAGATTLQYVCDPAAADAPGTDAEGTAQALAQAYRAGLKAPAGPR
jgi:hypothetical protein